MFNFINNEILFIIQFRLINVALLPLVEVYLQFSEQLI